MRTALLFVTMSLSILLSSWAQVPEPDGQRVLVLHSYHQGFHWTDSVQEGIEAAFSDAGLKVEIDIEYLDTKRHPGDQLFPGYAGLYEGQFGEWQPDVVISMDDDAIHFLLAYRDTLFPGAPVVFGGLDADAYDGSLLAGRSGYTGVVERLDLVSTLDLILTIDPGVRRVFFVHDQTTSGLMHRGIIESLRPAYEDRIEFVFSDDQGAVSTAELLDTVEGLEQDTAVYFLGFFLDRLGRVLSEETIIPAIAEASPVPVYTHVESFFGSGPIGGKLLSPEVHGRAVGEKAVFILQGTPADDCPVTVESSNRYIFDDRRLRQFDISRDRLPPESIVRFEPTSFFYRYRGELIWAGIGLAMLVAFTAALGVNILRRRSVERRLVASEEKYRALVEKQSDMVVEVDTEGRFVFANPRYVETFGKSEEELIGSSFIPLVHPEDRQATSEAMEALYRPPYSCSLEQRAHTATGWRWIAWADRAVRDSDGRVLSIIGVGRDVTGRKEAEARLEQTLLEKDLLMKEINHRVKNNLMLVRSLINLKAYNLSGKEGAQAELADLTHQVDAIRIVHEKLYQQERFTSVSMPGYLREVVETVFASGLETGIEIEVDVVDVWLPTKTAVTLGLIVNEIATNAAKHAFDGGTDRAFSLALSLGEPGASGSVPLVLTLSNTGRLFPEGIDLEKSTTLGLKLVSELTKQIGGTLELERFPKTRFTLRCEVTPEPVAKSGPL